MIIPRGMGDDQIIQGDDALRTIQQAGAVPSTQQYQYVGPAKDAAGLPAGTAEAATQAIFGLGAVGLVSAVLLGIWILSEVVR